MNPLINYDLNANFWIFNPQMKLSFQELHIQDKSKDKSVSSNLMWLIAFMCEEEENAYAEVPEAERLNILIEDLGVKLPKQFDELLSKYRYIRVPFITRKLSSWKKKLDERDEFMDSKKYSEDTYEMLDKMMIGTDKIYKQYNTIVAELQKDNMTKDKGDKVASLSDSGDI